MVRQNFGSEADGLIYNHIQTVAVSDNNGNIWCAAYNKFSVFTPCTWKAFTILSLPLSENNLTYDNGLTRLFTNGNILASVQ